VFLGKLPERVKIQPPGARKLGAIMRQVHRKSDPAAAIFVFPWSAERQFRIGFGGTGVPRSMPPALDKPPTKSYEGR